MEDSSDSEPFETEIKLSKESDNSSSDELEPCTSQKKIKPRRKKLAKNNYSSIGEKNIVMNVYDYVEKTWPEEKNVDKKVSKMLGISVSSLYALMKNKDEKTNQSSHDRKARKSSSKLELDEYTKNRILKKIHNLYFEEKLPTMTKVQDLINNDPDPEVPYISRANFKRLYKKLNFKILDQKNACILIEKNKLVRMRRNFVLKIEKYRKENRPIYYTDETWIHTGNARAEEWRSKLVVAMHIGSEHGFVKDGEKISETDVQVERMDAAVFEAWFEQVLPKLEADAVVVMDSSPHHRRVHEELPAMDWKKSDIQAWLRSRGIAFEDDEFKAELLMKIDKNPDLRETYAVEELAKKFGVDVLKLPPYHNDLNAMTLVWEDVKKYVEENRNDCTIDETKKLLNEGIKLVTPEKWCEYVEKVKKEEERFYRVIDYKIDDTIDAFLVDANISSGSDTDSSSIDFGPE